MKKSVLSREEYGEAYEKSLVGTANLIISRGATADVASDIAQCAWVRGWECIEQLKDPALLTTWVNRIALNLYLTTFRHRKTRPAPLSRTDNLIQCEKGNSSWKKIDTDIYVREVLRMGKKIHDFDVFVLQHLGKMSFEEIAEFKGMTVGAVKSRSFRAHVSLKKHFLKHSDVSGRSRR